MRKILILALFGLSLCTKSYAQKEFGTYESSYFEKEYSVQLSFKSITDYDLWIDMKSLDDTWDESVCIKVSSKDYLEFISAFDSAKVKYEEWKKIADSSRKR